ncbi:hypothetical protein [Cupriavidus sp. SIMBA_020]|uniref:hypothetical protein n=1 Tax=Cupriavidus sp. SIMBA_020 TaxID=3085766 RepID=UPI003978B16B
MKRAMELARKHVHGIVLFLIAGGFAYLAYGFYLAPPNASQDWAAWAQAFGATVALGIAIYVPYRQRVDDRADRVAKETEQRGLTLLCLQEISAEIAQMCLLSGFQKDNPEHRTIYPNIADDFNAIAECLDRFPIERFIEAGRAEELRALRRISLQMALLHTADKKMYGPQFNVRHREQIGELENTVRKISLRLKDEIEEICPGKFTTRLRTRL